MTTLNISLPESMRAYVEAQAQYGDFTTSEYVRHLIRKDQERKKTQLAHYLALCEEQIARGEVVTQTIDEMFDEFEREYKKRKKK
jgi:antitoxin ParD1/3/4